MDQTSLDTIVTLASVIARRSPDCADDALRIADLARGLAAKPPDRGAIDDTVAACGSADDLSDVSERRLATSVADAALGDRR